VPRAAVRPRDEDVEYLDLRWAPYEGTPQAAAFDNDTPDARILVKGGFGSGKSSWLVGKCLKLSAINAPHTGMFVVPTFDHWDETILETLRSTDKNGRRWFLEDAQFHVKPLRSSLLFSWEGGGDWLVKSAKTRLVGANMAWVGADEPGLNAYKAYKDMVARLRHPAARLRQLVLGGTPEGLNWLAELFGAEKSKLYFVYTLDTRNNRELMAAHPEYVQDILRTSTEQEAAAYVGGEFRTLSGVLVYVTFDRAMHYRPDITPDPNLPLAITFDFNVDPMSCVIGQAKAGPYGREAHVLDGIIQNNSWTPQVCEEIIRRYGREAATRAFGFRGSRGWPGGAVVYGDATGGSRTPNSNKTNYDWIKELLGPEFPSFRIHESVTRRTNPAEVARTDAVNVLLRNALGQVRLFIRKREHPIFGVQQDPVYPLIRSLEQTIKAPGTDYIHKPAGETHTHPSDALGYWIAAEWPVEKPILVSHRSFANVDL
jgi:hypothetical protein